MTDDQEPPEDEFPGNVIIFTPGSKGTGESRRLPRATKGKVRTVTIPIVPTGEADLATLINEAKGDATRRTRAAAIMRSRMYSFDEIAQMLGYANGQQARAAVVSHVVSLDKGNELETLRYSLLGALEAQARRSIMLASADSFRDTEGKIYPNHDRLAWHKEARQDLEALARISGAQAASQIHLTTPESAELDEIVRQLEIAAGRVIEEPEVLVLDVIDEAAEDHDGE